MSKWGKRQRPNDRFVRFAVPYCCQELLEGMAACYHWNPTDVVNQILNAQAAT